MLTRVALLRAGAGAYARTAPYGHARLGPRPPACKGGGRSQRTCGRAGQECCRLLR